MMFKLLQQGIDIIILIKQSLPNSDCLYCIDLIKQSFCNTYVAAYSCKHVHNTRLIMHEHNSILEENGHCVVS